jgi:hypothetical protein
LDEEPVSGYLFVSLECTICCGSAALWAWASLVNLPIIGSGYGTITNLERFYDAMKKVAKLNASAAASAFLSALFQAIALYFAVRIAPG